MHACMHTRTYMQMGGMPHANSPHLAEWLCQLKESFLQTHDGTAHWWYWAGGDQGDNPAINTRIKRRKRMSITITHWILSTWGLPVLRTVKVGNNRARGNESWKQGDNPAINKRWGQWQHYEGGEQDTVAGWLVVLFEQLHLSCTRCAKCLGYIHNVRSEPLEVMKYPPASLGLGSVEIQLYCIALFQH